MRCFFAVLAAVVAAFVAPVAGAQTFDRYLTAGGTLALRDGVGSAVVLARGGIIGKIERGRVRIRDLAGGEDTDINVWGEEWSREIDLRTTVYGGTDLRFRSLGGAWRVRMKGRAMTRARRGAGS